MSNDTDPRPTAPDAEGEPALRRVIGLPLLILYGLGTTVGAGIYVLVGATVARAGVFAPVSFLVAAFVMMFTAGSFAELAGRVPKSSAEAAFVDAAFNRDWLTLATGLSILAATTIAAAAIALGCAGYIQVLVPLPQMTIAVAVVASMGVIAALGVKGSVTFAGILTVVEIAGLLAIVFAGVRSNPEIFSDLGAVIPPFGEKPVLLGVFSASLLAFFAFIGFDDVVNLAEETRNPKKLMPWAIGITLLIVTVIYFAVALVAVRSVPLPELAQSNAPIRLLFERLTSISPTGITLIAIVATMNGIVIQIIMAARVIFGLSRKNQLPSILSRINPVTRTPVNATVLITSAIIAFSFFASLEYLAALTSQIMLAVFTLVNLALVTMKLRGEPAPAQVFTVPLIIPIAGVVTCLALLGGSFYPV